MHNIVFGDVGNMFLWPLTVVNFSLTAERDSATPTFKIFLY